MYFVLFSHLKERTKYGRDYRGFQTEDEVLSFLIENGKLMNVDKIIKVLAELRFGLSAINPMDMEFVDTAEEAEGEKVGDFLPEEIPETDSADNISEEEQEIIDDDIIRKNKEALRSTEDVLERGDKAIAVAAEEMKSSPERTRNWKLCTTCKVNKVAPWSKYKICSKCRKPKGTRKYDMTKRKAKID